MPRSVTFVLFLLGAISVLGAGHYYLWVRFVRDVRLPSWGRKLGTALAVVLMLMVPIIMIATRTYQSDSLRTVYMIGYTWIGTAMMLVVSLGLIDALRLVVWLVRRFDRDRNTNQPKARAADEVEPVPEVPVTDQRTDVPKQRSLVGRARIRAIAAMVLGLGLTGYGVVNALRPATVERVTIPLPHLPSTMNGTRIVQLSDLHIGPTFKGDWLQQVVDRVNDLRPDVVAITGDLVDGSVEALGDHVRRLAKLRATRGVFFVTGNHEYYSEAESWTRFLRTIGIVVLRDEHVFVGDKDGGFYIAGVDDWVAPVLDMTHEERLARALRGIEPDRAVVLLAHQPRWIREPSAKKVDLQLSGHTHGGQIFPWSLFVQLHEPYLKGKHKVGNSWLYVNRGTGLWGPVMRIGADPEITVIELRSDPSG